MINSTVAKGNHNAINKEQTTTKMDFCSWYFDYLEHHSYRQPIRFFLKKRNWKDENFYAC